MTICTSDLTVDQFHRDKLLSFPLLIYLLSLLQKTKKKKYKTILYPNKSLSEKYLSHSELYFKNLLVLVSLLFICFFFISKSVIFFKLNSEIRE